MLDTILKITEEIPKQTPENYEIQLHSSTGFFIKIMETMNYFQHDYRSRLDKKLRGFF